jgi:hypothetical protein
MEIQVLQKYDAVVVPFDSDKEVLASMGVDATTIHPKSEGIAPLLSRLSPP